MAISRIVGGNRAPYTALQLLRDKVVDGEVIFDSNGNVEQEPVGCVLYLPGYAGAFSPVMSLDAACALADQENAKVAAEVSRGTDVSRIRPPGKPLTPTEANRFTAALRRQLLQATRHGVNRTKSAPQPPRPRGSRAS